MNYRSVGDLSGTVARNLSRISRDVDLVVGIPRSGLFAASLVSLHLNVPLTDLDGFLHNRMFSHGISRPTRASSASPHDCRSVLIIDDSIYSGREMARVRESIAQFSSRKGNVTYSAVYATPESAHLVDFCFEIVPGPRVFEWNLTHHAILNSSCVDIDGILCVDPTMEENDDGDRYRNFIEQARPLWIPTQPVGWLVTCRLEKYRASTEAWLARHGIRYRDLVMMNLPSMAVRRALGSHGRYKADVYERTGACLFIESSRQQAAEITRLSGKPVFCGETREMLTPDHLTRLALRPGYRILRKVKRVFSRVVGWSTETRG